MEVKLIKKENHYYFWSSDWNPDKNKGFVANSEGTTEIKLSIKNCEEIYNGLDMLVEVHAGCIWTQIDVIDPITHTCKSHISKGDIEEPMLDEDGCLILRRIKC